MSTHFIDGKWHEGSGALFSSYNPYDGKVNWKGNEADFEQVSLAVCAAAKAFEIWSTSSYLDRLKFLEKFRKELLASQDELSRTISLETGKPLWESKTEVGAMMAKLDLSKKSFEERCQPTMHDLGTAKGYTRYKGLGVCAVIGPFNLPAHLPNSHIIPALLAGNTIVFKSSELSPLVGQLIFKIWEKVQLPKGVINLIQGQAGVAKSILAQKSVKGIFFTGSVRVGREIHRQFGGEVDKMLALEMGGNNPLVVAKCQNIKAAAKNVFVSAFITSGQRCVCARRLILLRNEQNQSLLDYLIELAKITKVGDPFAKPQFFMGPIIHQKSAMQILEQEKSWIEQGGQSLLEMTLSGPNKTLISPGIIDTTTIKNRCDNEIFGPLLQVIWVDSFDQAIKEANNTSFGLSAGLISDDEKLFRKFFKKVRAGVINWNKPLTGASGKMPFGGVGCSGNYRPSAYFASDYCSYATASIESKKLTDEGLQLPGLNFLTE